MQAPRPLVIPLVSFLDPRDDLSGNPRVVATDAHACGSSAFRSVHLHLLTLSPMPASTAPGVLNDGLANRQTPPPVDA